MLLHTATAPKNIHLSEKRNAQAYWKAASVRLATGASRVTGASWVAIALCASQLATQLSNAAACRVDMPSSAQSAVKVCRMDTHCSTLRNEYLI